MPHKQKKKNKNAQKNGSTGSDNKSSPSEPDVLSLPVLATTNYQEIHQNEAEALRSIYGDDFEEVENRRSAWHVRQLQKNGIPYGWFMY